MKNINYQIDQPITDNLSLSISSSGLGWNSNSDDTSQGDTSVKTSIQSLSDMLDGPPSKYFKFPENNFDDYYPEFLGECFISYIRNPSGIESFFIHESSLQNRVGIIQLKKSNPTRLHEIPSDRDLFAIYLDGELFRAAKQLGISVSIWPKSRH